MALLNLIAIFQSATEMSSEIFLKKFLIKSCKSIFNVSAVNCFNTYIFKGSNYRFFGLLSKHISRTTVLTQASVITDWFYMFNLSNFILQRLI